MKIFRKNILLLSALTFTTLVSSPAFASKSYIDSGDLNRVLQGDLGANAGVGTTSCTLCHTNEAGGNSTINPTGFGADFETAGGDANQSDAVLLTALQAMYALDSDSDGVDNEEEFTQCSNPGDGEESVATTACVATNKKSSGGCGRIVAIGGPGGGGPTNPLFLALLLLPLALLLSLRKKRMSKIR